MTPEAFERAGQRLFGEKWKSPLSRALGLDYVTIWRYATGQAAIPRVVEIAITGLVAQEPPKPPTKRAYGPS